MSKYNLLHQLPIEIFHEIFSYLSAIDIFNGFFNINSYFNSILLSYHRYDVNFRLCLKTHFDLVCSRIQPYQIISLTLSDSNDTPGLFGLFFSQFNIKQFIRLRSLTLIEIEKNSLFQLMISLSTFNQKEYNLTSFSIINCFHSYSWEFPDAAFTQLFFYRLKRLVISNASYITENTNQLIHLRYLTIQECTIDDLQRIFPSTPMLHSLEITIYRRDLWMTIEDIPSQLKRLVLDTRIKMSMSDITEFLSKMPNLKHLELQAKVLDLWNGDDWIVLVKHLIKFDFKFQIPKTIIYPKAFINSFSTAFWLEEKRWFVVYNEQRLQVYTVPRFIDRSAEYYMNSSFEPPFHTTIKSKSPFFYENVIDLTINQCLCRSLSSYRFTNVRKLSFSGQIPLNQLQSIVDLSNVDYLKLPEVISIEDLERFFPNLLPRVYHLDLFSLPISYRRQSIIMKQIPTLSIQTINSASRLCHQFPNIERLYIGCVKSYRQIRRIIHRLRPQLSYISLSWPNNMPNHVSFLLIRDWLKQQNRHHQRYSYTYRCQNGAFSSIYLWINSDTNEVLANMNDGNLKETLENVLISLN